LIVVGDRVEAQIAERRAAGDRAAHFAVHGDVSDSTTVVESALTRATMPSP
jgi:hypothetical protein